MFIYELTTLNGYNTNEEPLKKIQSVDLDFDYAINTFFSGGLINVGLPDIRKNEIVYVVQYDKKDYLIVIKHIKESNESENNDSQVWFSNSFEGPTIHQVNLQINDFLKNVHVSDLKVNYNTNCKGEHTVLLLYTK